MAFRWSILYLNFCRRQPTNITRRGNLGTAAGVTVFLAHLHEGVPSLKEAPVVLENAHRQGLLGKRGRWTERFFKELNAAA